MPGSSFDDFGTLPVSASGFGDFGASPTSSAASGFDDFGATSSVSGFVDFDSSFKPSSTGFDDFGTSSSSFLAPPTPDHIPPKVPKPPKPMKIAPPINATPVVIAVESTASSSPSSFGAFDDAFSNHQHNFTTASSTTTTSFDAFATGEAATGNAIVAGFDSFSSSVTDDPFADFN